MRRNLEAQLLQNDTSHRAKKSYQNPSFGTSQPVDLFETMEK